MKASLRTKRAYRLAVRADSSARTGEDILGRARDLFMSKSYDDVTLQAVADGAGVALKTVLRRFGSKDALLLAVVEHFGPDERESRGHPVGDVKATARALAHRYEQTMGVMRRYWPLEDRIEAIGKALTRARRGHLEWLARVFAPFLPAREGALRQRRLAELFAATEIFVWDSLRRHLGLDAAATEAALVETLEALVLRWSMKERA